MTLYLCRPAMPLAICLFLTACSASTQEHDVRPALDARNVQPPVNDDAPQQFADSNPAPADQRLNSQPGQAAVDKPRQETSEAERIQGLIRELAKIEDPNLGLSPTMSGEGFAPVPWTSRMMSGILMNHGLESTDAFTKLVEYGPAALPFLLDSLSDNTPTQLTIEHGGGFGGMWYGQSAGIRWAAWEVEMVQHLVEEKAEEDEITTVVDASPEFIAMAKTEKFPYFLPQAQREFNPRNPAENEVLEQARQRLIEMKGQSGDVDRFDSVLREYTVTVGDVCYVIVGQITNRTYLAAQYQPTACVYIHSPTHDKRIAEEVRAVWTSETPAEMLLASLKTDFESADVFRGYHNGAVLRLGYYFPEKSGALLLELLAKLDSPEAGEGESEGDFSSYENIELLEAIVASRNEAVQERVFAIMKTTRDANYFLALSHAYGKEHDSLILQRTKNFIEALPETDDYDSNGISLLRMLGDRFPTAARQVYEQFVQSPSTHRRDTVINALWYSPLAPELLSPLLDDKRLLHYTNAARVCDRAAQAISNNENIAFKDESSEKSRDGQIQKIKLHCIGIGVRKTGGAR